MWAQVLRYRDDKRKEYYNKYKNSFYLNLYYLYMSKYYSVF